jgi:hypothetical protein
MDELIRLFKDNGEPMFRMRIPELNHVPVTEVKTTEVDLKDPGLVEAFVT